MPWYGWMIIGAVLLGAELFAIDAQFFLVFMGLSAAIVGFLGLFGVVMPEWAQWLTFAVLSLVTMFTFRKSLYEKVRGGAVGFHASIPGNTVEIKEDLAPGKEIRAEYRGTVWTMRNVGDGDIAAGTRAEVVKVDGLTLHITAQ
ncbi:MAG: NfeD family protein [Woeseiaceae bacterium]|nr:NfeD family protein [Woeseiaceae bacterium]